ncbi:MAG: TIR domain-containing protein [Lachnospiraceae bacterium]|nr:TIR domain-containing protein [Lachnospiraceae bacterium]
MKPIAYEGEDKYIFISYAHKDSATVMPIMERLEQSGFRIWYDDGIAPGSEWPENIAQHMDKSDVVMAFISPNSMDSANCRREITFALSRQKKFLSVMIEETTLPLGVELQISAQQSVLRHNFRTEEEFLARILGSEILKECKTADHPALQDSAPAQTQILQQQNTAPQSTPVQQQYTASQSTPVQQQYAAPQSAPVQQQNIAPQNTFAQQAYTTPQTSQVQQPNYVPQGAQFGQQPGYTPQGAPLAQGNVKKKKNVLPILIPVAVIFLIIVVVIVKKSSNSRTVIELPKESMVGASELPSGTPIGYNLEMIGNFDSTDSLTAARGSIGSMNGQQFTLYSAEGESFEESYVSCTPIGNGLSIVCTEEGSVYSTGLISLEEGVLIPCAAAKIDVISDRDGINGGRFLRVVYAGSVTDDPNDYICFTTDGTIRSTPADGDVLYEGYALIYDTETRSFISELHFDNPVLRDYMACGEHVWVVNKDGSGALIDIHGNTVFNLQDTNGLQVGNGYFIIKDGRTQVVYDENGNECFSSGITLRVIDSTRGYLCRDDDDAEYALDLDGNVVGSGGFYKINQEAYGILYVTVEKNKYALLRVTGEMLYQGKGLYSAINGAAFFRIHLDKGTDLVGYNGLLVEGYENSVEAENMMIHTEIGAMTLNNYEYTFSLREGEIDYLSTALCTYTSNDSGKIGVIDLFTGHTLLECEYSEILYVNGYIFARYMDTWTVYRVETVCSE